MGGASDEIVHQSTRLRIMAALDSQSDSEPLEFPRLKAITTATDGNLGAHLGTLEKAGYIAVEKVPAGKRTRTLVSITSVGRRAFHRHLAYLRGILDDAGLSP